MGKGDEAEKAEKKDLYKKAIGVLLSAHAHVLLCPTTGSTRWVYLSALFLWSGVSE